MIPKPSNWITSLQVRPILMTSTFMNVVFHVILYIKIVIISNCIVSGVTIRVIYLTNNKRGEHQQNQVVLGASAGMLGCQCHSRVHQKQRNAHFFSEELPLIGMDWVSKIRASEVCCMME